MPSLAVLYVGGVGTLREGLHRIGPQSPFVQYSPTSVGAATEPGPKVALREAEVSGALYDDVRETGFLWPLVCSPTDLPPAANVAAMLVCQAVATVVALLLDACGLNDATIVIVFVLGVLATSILTVGSAYSLVASVVSILSYNFFLIEPRLSLAINGRDYVGTITAMVVFALLATYLVRLMRRSLRLSAEATMSAQREQLRANMLRSVSHDLRTPLTAICGNADMLLDERAGLTQGRARALVQDIYDDATWLTGVVENLLAVTRIEDGKVSLAMQAEVVNDVIEEAMRHVSRDAARHTIAVTPSDELLMARMDPQVIVQVIVNLVNNAITHTPEGSSIEICAERAGSLARIVVADDGPGVSEQDRDRVFDAFYTSEGELADARRGAGLGLSLCKSIVEAHGGTISLEGAEPHGAVFSFTLPLEEVPSHA